MYLNYFDKIANPITYNKIGFHKRFCYKLFENILAFVYTFKLCIYSIY